MTNTAQKQEQGHMAKRRGGQNKKPESWWLNSGGYLEGRVWIDENTQIRAKKHRWIMQQHLGRKLLPDEDVHHKDENKLNNEISNLEVIKHGTHSVHHHLGSKRPKITGERISKALKEGYKKFPERRETAKKFARVGLDKRYGKTKGDSHV